MEVCKNKSTGQYFIFINETGDDEALMVTAIAEIKSLKLNLFHDIEEFDENWLLSENFISDEQVKRFHQYEKNRFEDQVAYVESLFHQMPPDKQQEFLEKLKNRATKKNK